MKPDQASLLEWLCARYPESPRTRVKGWFAAGRVRLDEKTVRRAQERMPDPGERLALVDKADATGAVQKDFRLHQGVRLVHLDAALAVVSKAAGILSVPAPGREEPSALDFLQKHLERSGTPDAAALPVHRLDAYTSGLLCFGITPESRAHLIDQVRSHTLERTYLAYVEGAPSEDRGTWVDWFKLDEEGVRQFVVREGTPGATRAVTHFERLTVFRQPTADGGDRLIAKLRLKLETGLKHQIRLQAAAAGTPLLGDRGYHPVFSPRHTGKRGKQASRQALHAVRLGLIHPVSGEPLSWEAPMPHDLAQFEADLRRQQRPHRGAT